MNRFGIEIVFTFSLCSGIGFENSFKLFGASFSKLNVEVLFGKFLNNMKFECVWGGSREEQFKMQLQTRFGSIIIMHNNETPIECLKRIEFPLNLQYKLVFTD